MKALGLRGGDEVITTAHSWISTSETITQAGGRVVFSDTQPDTFNIDAAKIEARITPRTVGIIPVHLYGQPAEMDAIMAIAAKHKLWVIEDCAQAHLARYKGQTVGTFGDIATFSFYPGKNLGAYGDAGCAVTNDDRLADWMTTFARHGGKGEHVMEGINSRMDGLAGRRARRETAAPARMDGRASARGGPLHCAARWRRGHRHTGRCTRSRARVPLYVIRTGQRDGLRAHLTKAGIAHGPELSEGAAVLPGIHVPWAHTSRFSDAYANQSRILSLPIYPEMTDEMIQFVVAEITRFFAA
jgi:dTDP-4-amino-4,6-dideoxygalactose transaminase